MGPRHRWATGVTVVIALAAGAGGGAYLWKEMSRGESGAGGGDAGVVDASTDARAGRGKKAAKRGGGRGAKPPGAPRTASGGGGGGGGGGSGVDDHQNDEPDDVVERFEPPFRGRGPAGPTYEAALATNNQEINLGGKAEPDLTDAQITGPMKNGFFVGECGAPDSMKVTVKVAIRRGRAAGVSVSTTPPDPDVAGCIDRYVRTFSWPSSSKMDSFTTTY